MTLCNFGLMQVVYRSPLLLNSPMKPLTFKLFLALTLTLGVLGQSSAADYPNVLGTWERVSGSRATTGTEQNKLPPTMSASGDQGLQTMRIDEQKGGAFVGEATLATGEKYLLAGAFRKDGKRYVISSDIGVLSGELMGNELEACFTTLLTSVNIAGCYQLKKLSQ
jgi:hypothetical protein